MNISAQYSSTLYLCLSSPNMPLFLTISLQTINLNEVAEDLQKFLYVRPEVFFVLPLSFCYIANMISCSFDNGSFYCLHLFSNLLSIRESKTVQAASKAARVLAYLEDTLCQIWLKAR